MYDCGLNRISPSLHAKVLELCIKYLFDCGFNPVRIDCLQIELCIKVSTWVGDPI